jgi:phosphoesterase RecJ-like protein
MNYEIMKQILEKIKEYDSIMLFRHFRPDGDCKGATMGLRDILRLSFPEKKIYLINDDHSDFLEFMGQEDPDVANEIYEKSLAIVLDTATMDRIHNKKFALCKELIKIDHHIENNPYGDISWVEDYRSSACEMVAHFYNTFRDELKIDVTAATHLYTGMVTDSGRFQFSSVSGDTLRLAGMLLDMGINTELMFAHLQLKEFHELKFKSYLYKKMKITPNGVASIYIDRATMAKFGLTSEEASASVSALADIKGCLCWIAFIDSLEDEKIRVRLRSRFVAINSVAEHYRGGGHAQASGATLHDKKEMRQLLKEADKVVKEYKETHEDWL